MENSKLLYTWLSDGITQNVPDTNMAKLLVNVLDDLVTEAKVEGFSCGTETGISIAQEHGIL